MLRLPMATMVAVLSCACTDAPWNHPYTDPDPGQVLYSSFGERPKFLDPARSYSTSAYVFIAQVYEPPLGYHYLRRPFALQPLTATRMPEVRLLDAQGEILPEETASEEAAYTEYEIEIRPGILYQPHPALARGADGAYRYHALAAEDLDDIDTLADFPGTGTRELVARDYVYQIKRIADSRNQSPIAGIMSEYIVGFSEFRAAIRETGGSVQEVRAQTLEGVREVSRYRYRIRLRGSYPQFRYWLAMPFFSPMPWEADAFYRQPGMERRNLNLDWHPIGTGPFMLTENNPNLRMVLARNPNFRGEPYPAEGMPGDAAAGLLEDAGRITPFLDRAVYSLEKESIPRWTKFLQGYYDLSGIGSDNFDQAVHYGAGGSIGLTEEMRAQGIVLRTAVDPTIYYMGFNMLDAVVGGGSERALLLRRAISIAVDYEEYISIFANGRGIPAQGPLPPQIFGVREGRRGINDAVYRWHDGIAVRRDIGEAQELLRRAGYGQGVDPATGRPLVLYYDAVGAGPDAKAQLNWLRKQFAKLGIELVVRATDYNRFRDKVRKGTAQIFQWGWHADYPDPENFLFLLYGPNSETKYQGPNATNYENAEYDALFARMKNIPNSATRRQVIDEMLRILRHDAPWVWGYHPVQYTLSHRWVDNYKPNPLSYNTLKYLRIDSDARARALAEWNRPVVWPLWILAALLVLLVLPAVAGFVRAERARGR